ncbi:MAG: saccharopine dehydrogenase family protein [Candidatus Hodarchaeales archaeon]|jgi:saccharopine dehydrogenase-like NADP-dependent oxidoreductase
MKLLILGAAGDMGSYILRDAVKFGDWTNITVADINEKRARQLINELNDPRLDYRKVDATQHSQLVDLLEGYDVACSAIGPFYFFGPKVVKAAIEAKTPLVDICDDSGPTLEILKMDEEAKSAKIPIFLGYGWTPGLTNLLARYAYNKLDKDKPIEFDISWAGGAADSEGLAVIMHVLYAVTGDFPTYIDGEYRNVPAGKGNVRLDFPEPLGTIGVFDCGHPEPVTIPKFLPEVTKCTLKGGLTPDWNNKFADSMKQLHLTQGKFRKQVLGKLVHLTESIFATGGVAASSARVDIQGTYKGKNIHWVYATPSLEMGELTGYPAAITAQLFAQGKLAMEGIIPPEAISDPTPFFDEMRKRKIEMIFDENEPLQIFKKPEPFTPGFVARYGLSIGILVFLGIILWFMLGNLLTFP